MTFDYEQSAADYEQAFRQVERWDDVVGMVASRQPGGRAAGDGLARRPDAEARRGAGARA